MIANGVECSYSKAGYPYDNAVSEKVFGIFKTEWAKEKYESTEELERDVGEFVNWYNNFRCHGSIDYMTPVEKRLKECSI
ncbi:MAG: integrase core domain-containing protein [Coprobacillaceae bacterium]